jgi:hypothetical protein
MTRLTSFDRKHAKLHFACQGRTGEHCLYKTTLYTMKTRNPRTWIHLMFLALQVTGIKIVLSHNLPKTAVANTYMINLLLLIWTVTTAKKGCISFSSTI